MSDFNSFIEEFTKGITSLLTELKNKYFLENKSKSLEETLIADDKNIQDKEEKRLYKKFEELEIGKEINCIIYNLFEVKYIIKWVYGINPDIKILSIVPGGDMIKLIGDYGFYLSPNKDGINRPTDTTIHPYIKNIFEYIYNTSDYINYLEDIQCTHKEISDFGNKYFKNERHLYNKFNSKIKKEDNT